MALLNLLQLGVGPSGGFALIDSSQTWGDLLTDNNLLLTVPTYISLKVKMMFDQQAMTSIMRDLCQAECEQLEWRIREQVEYTAHLEEKKMEENGDS